MAYFYETTNKIKLRFYDVTDGSGPSVGMTLPWVYTFSGDSNLDPKDLSKEYETLNNEIVTDDQGIRMFIKISLLNREGLNDGEALRKLINYIDYIKRGTCRVQVYPMWDSTKIEDTLDCFDCIIDKHHSIAKLHKFLDAGTDIKIVFKTYVPIYNYMPKHPLYPSGGGGSSEDTMDGQVILQNILGDIAT